ncbi:hypothetical protein Bbelb_319060 [Branchiostoma belcheri]|nr:hypothetical protein Bbelb_319060 [Branchiostoma belcheri]
MSGKHKGYYSAVFNELLDTLPEHISVQECIVDYEETMWRVIPQLLSHVHIRVCNFHWKQAVWRKVQEFGLQKPYMEDEGIHSLTETTVAELYPSMKLLASVLMVIPVSTADSERSFSNPEAGQDNDTLNAVLTISIDGPSVNDLDFETVGVHVSPSCGIADLPIEEPDKRIFFGSLDYGLRMNLAILDWNRALTTCNTHLVQPQSRQCGLRMAADGPRSLCSVLFIQTQSGANEHVDRPATSRYNRVNVANPRQNNGGKTVLSAKTNNFLRDLLLTFLQRTFLLDQRDMKGGWNKLEQSAYDGYACETTMAEEKRFMPRVERVPMKTLRGHLQRDGKTVEVEVLRADTPTQLQDKVNDAFTDNGTPLREVWDDMTGRDVAGRKVGKVPIRQAVRLILQTLPAVKDDAPALLFPRVSPNKCGKVTLPDLTKSALIAVGPVLHQPPAWRDSNHLSRDSSIVWRDSNHLYRDSSIVWRDSNHLSRDSSIVWRDSNHLSRDSSIVWRDSRHLSRDSSIVWRDSRHLSRDSSIVWRDSRHLSRDSSIVWRDSRHLSRDSSIVWRDSNHLSRDSSIVWRDSRHLSRDSSIVWRDSNHLSRDSSIVCRDSNHLSRDSSIVWRDSNHLSRDSSRSWKRRSEVVPIRCPCTEAPPPLLQPLPVNRVQPVPAPVLLSAASPRPHRRTTPDSTRES